MALSAHTPRCNLVPHVSACWLTGLGLGTPSRYRQEQLAGTPVNYHHYDYHIKVAGSVKMAISTKLVLRTD